MTPPHTLSSSLAALLLLAAVLAGCATHVGRCAGAAGAADPVRVPIHAEGGDAALHDEIRDLLTVKIKCGTASYDPVTEQGRWPYRIELTNTASESSARKYEIHLTTLERVIANGLEATFDGKPAGILRPPFHLDTLRADLHIAPGRTITFPCAETVVDARGDNRRNRSGLLTVRRWYTGDVTIREGMTTQFVPVRIDFYVEFLVPGPNETAAASTGRQAEWARVTHFCETCRPVILCESLGRQKPTPSEPKTPVYQRSRHPELHFVAGLEKRSVVVDGSVADRRRTVACTRWTRVDRTSSDPVEVMQHSDGTEEGIAGATPFLLVHHKVLSRDLPPGTWIVDLFLADRLDPWGADGRVDISVRPKPVNACESGAKALSTSFELR